jgi:hypothetical protein
MFRDVALDDSGQLLWAINDTRRNTVLGNGVIQPALKVRRRYRFRC